MRAALFFSFASIVIACTASEAPTAAPATTDKTPTAPAPTPVAPPVDAGAPPKDSGPPKNECKLTALGNTADVTPEVVIYSTPDVVPPAMTGGTLSGSYVVDKAIVFLPTAAAGIADPSQSSGTVNGWAVFDGTNYRLQLKVALSIATSFGPQSQTVDTASQGGFNANNEALVLDHACDSKIDNEADYSFTDDGSGRATILVKTSSPYGDTYLQLDATKK